ncbi:MAG: flagellar assembly protein FliW [Ignavibacteriaceae bacterium]|nr:flagellar assembly protein FliW [Ignavibacteriaceae bacterium]HRI46060.1 flagellar assembly protein FliW [Ignavibacteriaceae bacterium]
MKITTVQFGEIEFDEDMIVHFENGLIGFEELKKFVFIKNDDDLFYWLNSVEKPEIAFPLIGTRIIDEDYPTVENNEAFGVITLNKDPLNITINLKVPVYINQDSKTGFQKILDTDKYPLRYKLFVE